MKHIKAYKIFESIDSIKEYLEDIALDLSDEGFLVKVIIPDKGNYNFYSYCVNITNVVGNKPVLFKLGGIKDIVCRMKDYMESINYSIVKVNINISDIKNFRLIKGNVDPNQWDDNLEVVNTNIYFDNETYKSI